MSKYRPKAEVMFEAKMKRAIEERDFDAVASLFHQFGCYLLLIEPPSTPAGFRTTSPSSTATPSRSIP